MKGRNISSIIATLILLSVAFYMYYTTQDYKNATIWIVASPLFLSLHPIFRENAKDMKMEKNDYDRLKALFNFIRFSLFSLGLFMFFYQIFNDLKN